MRTHFVLFTLIFFNSYALAADNTQNNPAYDQARQDYREYLKQLKVLSRQYKEVTGEMKKVIQEEGVPVWDDNEGGIEWVKPELSTDRVEQTPNEMVMKFEVPGLLKNSLKIRIDEANVLQISGRYKEDGKQPFQERVKLPALAKGKDAEARYEDGILTVRIPKAEPAHKEIAVPVK